MLDIRENKQGKYEAKYIENDNTVMIGIFKEFTEALRACDEYWDREIFPKRKLTLARYM